MAEQSEAKSAKRSFASKSILKNILKRSFASRYFASLRSATFGKFNWKINWSLSPQGLTPYYDSW